MPPIDAGLPAIAPATRASRFAPLYGEAVRAIDGAIFARLGAAQAQVASRLLAIFLRAGLWVLQSPPAPSIDLSIAIQDPKKLLHLSLKRRLGDRNFSTKFVQFELALP